MPASYAGRTNDALEAERRYAKDRALTQTLKRSFPNPIDLEGLTDFIDRNLRENKLAECMTEFGIPSGTTQDKKKFSRALAVQFSLFITKSFEDLDNNIYEIYQGLLAGKQISATDISGPLIAGDDVVIGYEGRQHNANCYETFTHVWNLQNSGKILWENRCLVLINQSEIHPRPTNPIISVPVTKPGQFIKIATDIDVRGFEGNYECKWEMQDAYGDNCFPNKKWSFNFQIQVRFNSSDKGDMHG